MEKRVRPIIAREINPGPVAYWMNRDQRVQDNWALLFAKRTAERFNSPLAVIFCLVPDFIGATIRQYRFMINGLREVERDLAKLSIPFILLTGNPVIGIEKFVKRHKISTLATDFFPLKIKRGWLDELKTKIDIPFFEVDTHNIVPCREASQKAEYAAYTFRPKINKKLVEYLLPIPPIKKHAVPWITDLRGNDWGLAEKSLEIDKTVPPVDGIKPGARAAERRLRRFLKEGLADYYEKRNDPAASAQSGLSPYLHFGQLSPQRVALEVQKFTENIKTQETFLEELIVRRELSDNYCFHNDEYDSYESFPGWARATLEEHADDPRPYLCRRDELEAAETHDSLWNAAQTEMVYTGRMHGYMRMYWAKKILEWSRTPAEALGTAIYLNDRYQLDGRDPNGYAGIGWSIGGVHDRPWPERDIFGKIRYMSYDGCRRKFDVNAYIDKMYKIKARYSK